MNRLILVLICVIACFPILGKTSADTDNALEGTVIEEQDGGMHKVLRITVNDSLGQRWREVTWRLGTAGALAQEITTPLKISRWKVITGAADNELRVRFIARGPYVDPGVAEDNPNNILLSKQWVVTGIVYINQRGQEEGYFCDCE